MRWAADLAKAGHDGGVLALGEDHNARPAAVLLREGRHLHTTAYASTSQICSLCDIGPRSWHGCIASTLRMVMLGCSSGIRMHARARSHDSSSHLYQTLCCQKLLDRCQSSGCLLENGPHDFCHRSFGHISGASWRKKLKRDRCHLQCDLCNVLCPPALRLGESTRLGLVAEQEVHVGHRIHECLLEWRHLPSNKHPLLNCT